MRTTRPPLRTAGRMGLALALAGGMLLSACGDDEDDASTDSTTTEAAAETTEGTEAPAGETLEITLVDYAFEGVPEEPIPAGTKVTVKNDSDQEFHELVAFKLPDDETRSSEELVNLPEEELGALFAGEPATVLLAGPHGEQHAAVGDGTLAEPGRYLILCSIPTGADPEELEASIDSNEPPAEDPNAGPPHFVQGMHAELVVE